MDSQARQHWHTLTRRVPSRAVGHMGSRLSACPRWQSRHVTATPGPGDGAGNRNYFNLVCEWGKGTRIVDAKEYLIKRKYVYWCRFYPCWRQWGSRMSHTSLLNEGKLNFTTIKHLVTVLQDIFLSRFLKKAYQCFIKWPQLTRHRQYKDEKQVMKVGKECLVLVVWVRRHASKFRKCLFLSARPEMSHLLPFNLLPSPSLDTWRSSAVGAECTHFRWSPREPSPLS